MKSPEELVDWEKVRETVQLNDVESGWESRALLNGLMIGLEASLSHWYGRSTRRVIFEKILPLLPKDIEIGAVPYQWMDLEHIINIDLKDVTSFSGLMESLPEDQRDLVIDKAFDSYLWEVGCLQRYSDMCKGEPKAYFYPFQKSGSQFIANFGVNDVTKALEGKINWHGRDTSQWVYAGGMLVQDGRVSLHH